MENGTEIIEPSIIGSDFFSSEKMYQLIIYLSWLMIIVAFFVFLVLVLGKTATYGRYGGTNGISIPSSLAWFIQECPSFFIPLYFIFLSRSDYGILLNLMFLLHYFNRTFLFPLKLKSKNGSLWYIVLSAFSFCTWNGFIQGAHNALFQSSFSNTSWIRLILLCFGVCLFVAGSIINQRADKILFNLRKPGETGYKIPTGELYEYVSCPNYFGEIIEWIGYALAAQSLPATAFAIFTFSNIGPRALSHHKWYQEKFSDYPKKRKALIPFVL